MRSSDIVEIGGCCAGVPARVADILDTQHITFGPVPGFPPARKTVQLGGPRRFEVINRLKYLPQFLDAIAPYDVLHYHYRSHVPQFVDVPLWKALGKQVWVSFHGSDIRGQRIKAANPFLRLADRIFVSTPDLLDTLPGAEWLPNPAPEISSLTPKTTSPTVVTHCPSNPARKGTPEILAATQILQECGERFELHLVRGKPHAETLSEIQAADIVIDQAKIGMYGMVSIEAMACGKPVLAYLNGARDRLPRECPIVNCGTTPAEIASALADLLGAPSRRQDLGQKGREYAQTTHGAANIRRILS